MESAVNVQERVIDAFKRQDWIIAVEKMKNPLCFYVESTSPKKVEQMLSDLKEGFLKKNIAEVLYSKIEKIYTSNRKDTRNVRRVQG